jgi:ribosome maturation factor RimP
MDQTLKIETLIGPAIDLLGYDLVRVQIQGAKHQTLQVMAERRDGRGMKVDDCTRISRALSELLDAADPIQGDYTLEVSSPGIDRPLIRPADYARFVGHDAKIELDPPVAGRKRVQGPIAAVAADHVVIAIDAEPVALPFAAVRRAKLVLTDRLIAEALRSGTAEAVEDGAIVEDGAAVAPHVQ